MPSHWPVYPNGSISGVHRADQIPRVVVVSAVHPQTLRGVYRTRTGSRYPWRAL